MYVIGDAEDPLAPISSPQDGSPVAEKSTAESDQESGSADSIDFGSPAPPNRGSNAKSSDHAAHLSPPSSPEPSLPATADSANDSPWAPLQVPIFRAFWVASLISNLGTWVHEVGAGWLMTGLDSSPQMVSAVRIAIAGPTMLLAIPAGVIADRIDRRRLLILTQLLLLTTTSLLATLTFAGVMTSWSLLFLTFVIGMGVVMHVLTWQSTIPVLVPKPQIARAIALGSISFNLARAIGPAFGGVLIALAGPWAAFAFNAMSFAGVLVVLYFWKREPTESSRGLTFAQALREGFVYVLRQARMRNVLTGVLLFLLPATALWSLLPLVAREQLGWHAQGYGMLVTSIGVGAVVAARILHVLHRWLLMDRTIALAMVCFSIGLLVLGTTSGNGVLDTIRALAACVLMGSSWMITLTSLNASAQTTLPDHLRARGMGCYMTTMALSMTVGAFLWGQVAGQIGLSLTQWTAAATLIVTAAVSFRFPVDATKH